MNDDIDALNEEMRKRSEKSIRGRKSALCHSARSYRRAADRLERITWYRRIFKKLNASVLYPDAKTISRHVFYLALILGAWGWDVGVYGAVARHIAVGMISAIPIITDVLSVVVRLVIPAVIIMLELGLSMAIHMTGDRFSNSYNPAASRLLQFVGVVFALGVGTVLATSAAATRAVDGAGADGIGYGEMIFLALVMSSTPLHLAIILLDDVGEGARTFWVAWWRRRRIERAVEMSGNEVEANREEVDETGTALGHALVAHEKEFGEVPYLGPFDETVKGVLNEIYRGTASQGAFDNSDPTSKPTGRLK